jgi:hypothetical protein
MSDENKIFPVTSEVTAPKECAIKNKQPLSNEKALSAHLTPDEVREPDEIRPKLALNPKRPLLRYRGRSKVTLKGNGDQSWETGPSLIISDMTWVVVLGLIAVAVIALVLYFSP